jgi:hypothetical protein
MAGKTIVDLCEMGDAADRLYLEGDYEGAEDAYMRLLRQMKSRPSIDSYLMAKLTLGMMLTLIRAGKIQDAFNIWTASLDNESSLFGVGVHGLENGQVSVKDTVLYDFVCSYFHSLSGGDPKEAVEAMNFYMNRICDFAKDKCPELLPVAVANWTIQLQNIFEGPAPAEYLEDYKYWSRLLGREPKTAEGTDVIFPEPSRWVADLASGDDSQAEFVAVEAEAKGGRKHPRA